MRTVLKVIEKQEERKGYEWATLGWGDKVLEIQYDRHQDSFEILMDGVDTDSVYGQDSDFDSLIAEISQDIIGGYFTEQPIGEDIDYPYGDERSI